MNWYTLRAETEKAVLWLYDVIGEDFWGEGVKARDLCKEIHDLDIPLIEVHINSPGGSVFDGIAIYNALKAHSAKVVCFIDGWAASIASVIACAGDETVCAENGEGMIHKAWGICRGNDDDMARYAELLGHCNNSCVKAYVDKSGCDEAGEQNFRDLMAAETWLDAQALSDLGLVDVIGLEVKAAAKVPDFSAFGYLHAPEVAPTPQASEPDGAAEGSKPSPDDASEGESAAKRRELASKRIENRLRKV